MTVTLSKKLEKEISSAAKEYGYDSKQSFIEDTLRHRILLLKRGSFIAGAKSVRRALKKKGISTREIRKDFELSRS